MMSIPWYWYPGAFAVALGLLIVIHELGHYFVARWVGIKVLRFSIGFGRPIVSRRFGRDGTEWVLAVFPLGGYVRMLDEHEDAVAPEELHRAFNRQSVWRRILVVAAGPIANFLLAIFLYWLLFISGIDELRPYLGTPPAATAAAKAGVEAGELVRAVSGTSVTTFQDLHWRLIGRILDGQPTTLEVINDKGEIAFRHLDTESIPVADLDTEFERLIGIVPFRPKIKPMIGEVVSGDIAEAAGLRSGDLILAIDGQAITSWVDIVQKINGSPGQSILLLIERQNTRQSIAVVPGRYRDGEREIGRIGIVQPDDPDMRERMFIHVRLSPATAIGRALTQTWDTSTFTLRMIGRLLTGKLSWRNISGPLTIADYAGRSARLGMDSFLQFLALISISLGVFNLLPIPLLDGGHLLYYLAEVIKGSPPSERAMEIGQRIGLAFLVVLMAFAFFNDFTRFFSG